MPPQFEVADVLRHVDLTQPSFTVHQQKTLRALRDCRTAALGGHIDACDRCGNLSISYNSCRNRHCPKCQGHKRMEWVNERSKELLPCSYYHVVFTLPHELHGLALHDPSLVYKCLFEATWATLHQFGKQEGSQVGMIAILHTWGQNLSLHPHLHCIIPGGVVDKNGNWKRNLKSDRYLFSVKALSKVFRAKYVGLLRTNGITDQLLLDSLFSKSWVVYAKRPFGGPKQVIEYLGRYTHKVAVSNHRIKAITSDHTAFVYKDYRSGGIQKVMSLSNSEFVRRFSQHILPRRFVRIRHYGILSSSWKRAKLPALQLSLRMDCPVIVHSTLHRRCPCCKEGTLITIELLPKRGPPKLDLRVARTVPVPLA